MNEEQHLFINQGWRCPQCGTIWAPTIICCSTCSTLRVVSVPSVWACTCGQGLTAPCPLHPNCPPYKITCTVTNSVSGISGGVIMYNDVAASPCPARSIRA